MHAVQIVECLQIYVYIIFSPKMGEVEGQQIEFIATAMHYFSFIYVKK